MATIGFIVVRHINSNETNEYWKECYTCIRKFYPLNEIVIIDNDSNYKFVTTMDTVNTTIIQSEYKNARELSAYLYYIKNKKFDAAVILQDSVFLNSTVKFEEHLNKFLWDFEHTWDDPDNELYLISKLDNNSNLQVFYNTTQLWKGCFGTMSVISYNCLESINKKYNLFNLIPYITDKTHKMCLERLMAVLISYEKYGGKDSTKDISIFGNIHEHIIYWGFEYADYKKNDLKYREIYKVFTHR